MKKIIFAIILSYILFVSCSNKSEGIKSSSLVLSLRADPIYLNPVLAYEIPSLEVCSWIFNGLVKINSSLQVEPDLAEKWEVTPDGLIWTFYLRKNVLWHDGTPFTAKDVKFTVEAVLSSDVNTFNRSLFLIDDKPVEVKIISPYICEFRLPKPFAPFLYNLTLGIIPEHLLKGVDLNKCDFNKNPVGTGPFKFAHWRLGEEVLLLQNKSYFRGAPCLAQVIFRIIPEQQSRLIALESGQIDVASLPPKEFARFEHRKDINLYRWFDLQYDYLGFDLTNELFKDRKVRQAINYAIDKKQILQAVLKGFGKPATGPVPCSSWAYTASVQDYPYNPAKAEKLLKEAGWHKNSEGKLIKDKKIFRFKLEYGQGSENFSRTAVYIQHYLNYLGMEVEIRPVEFSVLVNQHAYPGKFEAMLLDWVEGPDPDWYIEWGCDEVERGMNFMSYCNPKVDEILKKARTILDIEKRKELYASFQQLVAVDAPYVFLWYPETIIAVKNKIKGLSTPGPCGLFIEKEKIYKQ